VSVAETDRLSIIRKEVTMRTRHAALNRAIASGHSRSFSTASPRPHSGALGWIGLLGPAVAAGATLVAAAWCARGCVGSSEAKSILALSAVALVTSFAVQLYVIARAWRRDRWGEQLHFEAAFFRRLTIAAFTAFLLALVIGARPGIEWVWAALISLAYAGLLLPLAASGLVLEDWRRWSQGRGARRLAWLVYASIVLVVSAEGLLQGARLAADRGWFEPVAPASLAATGNTPAAASPDFVQLFDAPDLTVPAAFKIAVLSEDPSPRAQAPGGYFDRLQRLFPGLEIVALDALNAVAGLNAQQPNLVLVATTPCAELSRAATASSWFDWRQYELARRMGAEPRIVTAPTTAAAVEEGFEARLRRLAPQLAACRTPIDDAMRMRWEQKFATLERLLAACSKRRIALGLVVVPSEFQMNAALCQTLARRSGASPDQIDVELPNRRLADFAQRHDLPLFDLLPHLRLSSRPLYERGG
jgi:hypothetical protein